MELIYRHEKHEVTWHLQMQHLRQGKSSVPHAKSTHNQQNADKNPLKEVECLMYKTPPEKTWKKVVVLKYLGHRSYQICAKDGAVYQVHKIPS